MEEMLTFLPGVVRFPGLRDAEAPSNFKFPEYQQSRANSRNAGFAS